MQVCTRNRNVIRIKENQPKFFERRLYRGKPIRTSYWKQSYYDYRKISDIISREVSFKIDRDFPYLVGEYLAFKDFVSFLSVSRKFFCLKSDYTKRWVDFLCIPVTSGEPYCALKHKFRLIYKLTEITIYQDDSRNSEKAERSIVEIPT